MRVRAQDANGDYTFGRSAANFLANSPAAVAQLAQTALLLWQTEWFLDVTAGTPYLQQILAKNSKASADEAIRTRVLAVQGVNGILGYSSVIVDRQLQVTMTLDTVYGPTPSFTVNL